MLQKAIFAAGCFWGVEHELRSAPGVESTRVGYTGGNLPDPSYRDVCSGATGHAEAVEVTYDPSQISYEALLELFWELHDPTTLNRQGPDIGEQYRSAIFYTSEEQREAAARSKEMMDRSGVFLGPIVTTIEPATEFYPAEDYHQQYFEKKGLASCHVRTPRQRQAS